MPLNSLPAEGDLGCMWIGTAQEERSEGETGNKTRRNGERRCVLEDEQVGEQEFWGKK